MMECCFVLYHVPLNTQKVAKKVNFFHLVNIKCFNYSLSDLVNLKV